MTATAPQRLCYCLNIHPTQTWPEVRAALTGPMRAVKAAVSPDAPMAAGLRFSAEALAALAAPGALDDLRETLAAEDYLAVTVNGFPYGRFHGAPVKAQVYEPDWRRPERLAYTAALADLMAVVAPQGETVSLSTVPGGFRDACRRDERVVAEGLLRAAAHCMALRARTGATVALAIEPEPACLIETTAEAAAFFADHLFSPWGIARLAELAGVSRAAAAEAAPRHLGLCYDVCHAAVGFEDAAGGLEALRAAGVPVHKLQLSAALRVPQVDAAARAALAAFAEPVYLHQVAARRDGALTRHLDLPGALARGAAADGEEWRVHFHVPVFTDALPGFATTQDFLSEVLSLHRQAPISAHLEVETYTWDVLPPALREGPVEEAIARELLWVAERLAP